MNKVHSNLSNSLRDTDINSAKRVACLGVGGKGISFVAKFFHELGVEVIGYNAREHGMVNEIKSLGINVKIGEPTTKLGKNLDIIVYSPDLYLDKEWISQDEFIKKLENTYTDAEVFELSEFSEFLISTYESGEINKHFRDAFKKSNIAPLYQIDSSKMKYIGVTGTDGKTTVTTMIYHILKENGFKPGYVSTVEAKIGNEGIDTGFHVTTPAAQDLYDLIKKAEVADCTHMILECTSHGLKQNRLAGLQFDVAIYTNITEEHLDEHKSWEGIFEAKSRLAKRHLKSDGVIVLNRNDDRTFTNMIKQDGDYLVYGCGDLSSGDKEDVHLLAQNIEGDSEGIDFELKTDTGDHEVYLKLLGEYNVCNTLASIGGSILTAHDLSWEDIISALATFQTVEGRMQVLKREPYMVIVDFAHTPSGLEGALRSARGMLDSENNRLISVFGCAGFRDPHKRAKMGRISGELSDITIVTAEDPRRESLKEINDEIVRGWNSAEKIQDADLIRFDDDTQNVKVRRDAIMKALEIAQDGDVVIICGKAHEQSLAFGVKEYPWNDIEETNKLIKEMNV